MYDLSYFVKESSFVFGKKKTMPVGMLTLHKVEAMKKSDFHMTKLTDRMREIAEL